MINVTKTFLPNQEEYIQYLNRAWEKVWLTNRGELTIELENKLKNHLGVNNIIITNNGTIPIQIALKILGNNSEIITTPFSYVATTSSIIWENCTPVFVDIHPEYLTIDESKIENAITPKTTAILATHVFGNPCEVKKIDEIAKKHDLHVIYDAAHAFGVKYENQSIFNFGDVSTCSFHATKIFHTGEGGAMFCNNHELNHKLFYSHNFGHNGPLDFHGLGINAKISELQSAMGLAVFDHIDMIFEDRKKVVEYYDINLNLNKMQRLKIREKTIWNYSYYPIIFDTEQTLLKVQEALNRQNIFPRRYFYPSLNKISYIQDVEMPISESISSRILCLPLYVGLKENELQTITSTINSVC
ncbi:DegT/DnrJ/EryC1/StrS family aminotransferase [Flavobacterium columnare]|uniref:DegT/DnrJ/EryC1/StrS family aminotransferase n=1 Tax=Flavobacterium columnare TaxID=996 RepID=A0AAI8CG04_9FLAO|nr:DegT/DnrJ/EryC1/StrS family aminotransferase [Flavobacterium columnare]AMO19477.1 DegT/DnrJ/EryC1/StrS family aminotransferase [Flavobacterium columnare]AUX17417.1 aminotransferase DegT [Flavobacterium columnare]MEB3800222.1 DegT/DnrJ/EryC1/StrS family aminotransferase [Flavobacterium columnare]QOG56444.1 DegT/DnrJ/EryC1/StrS family aminotransferase [Flavobacterium columnare]QOG61889.1 DegT/DnrJ/EryC1/StrS family aminotransferase [Flavobacterium columnare]